MQGTKPQQQQQQQMQPQPLQETQPQSMIFAPLGSPPCLSQGLAVPLVHDVDTFHDNFEMIGRDGSKARNKRTGRYVFVKTVKLGKTEGHGVPFSALREVALLKSCKHPNVLRLQHVVTSSSYIQLVSELLDMDLITYTRRHGRLMHQALRDAILQCFRGVDYCHRRCIIHRDLSPRSVLVSEKDTRFVIADFGCARLCPVQPASNTEEVVALWYRAPELLLGATNYGASVDIWSLGCILAQLATDKPLFMGDSEIDTLFRVFRLLGTPDEDMWPGVTSLDYFKKSFPKWETTDMADVVPEADVSGFGCDGVDLLKRCLVYPPEKRVSARSALRHSFFDGIDLGREVA